MPVPVANLPSMPSQLCYGSSGNFSDYKMSSGVGTTLDIGAGTTPQCFIEGAGRSNIDQILYMTDLYQLTSTQPANLVNGALHLNNGLLLVSAGTAGIGPSTGSTKEFS